MSGDDAKIRWLMDNFEVGHGLAQEMLEAHYHISFWIIMLKVMIHVGEEYYFSQDGKIHPKARIKAKRTDRTMV